MPDNPSVRKAAIKAGYAPSTASVDVYRALENPRISAAIQNRINRALKHHQVTPEEVLGSTVFQMRSSMDDLMDEDGFFDLQKARETGAIDLIKEIEFDETIDLETGVRKVRHKVKFDSASAARKEVANYIGLENFSNDSSQTEAYKFYQWLMDQGLADDEAKARAQEFYYAERAKDAIDVTPE